MTLTLLMIAGALLFCLWVRFRIMQAGYDREQLQEQRIELQRTLDVLVLEEETLKHPQRLEKIAGDLGMTRVRLGQILPVGVREVDALTADSLALANAPGDVRMRKALPGN
jgi:cell division protein FtsL